MGGFTIWQGLGIVVGAIAGFYTGGAGWALAGSIIMGASVGYGIGSLVDPNVPDVPQAGEPAMGELDMPTVEEGLLIPDFVGTQRIAGNIIWYDGSRSEEVEAETESGGKGGGGSSEDVITGYLYYLSWIAALAWGPVDELISVWRNDEVVWEGSLLDDGSGSQTITLNGIGSCTFCFGASNQSRIPEVGNYIGEINNTPHRNLCFAFMNDCYIGEYNRAPALRFVMRKTPAFDWSPYNRIGLYDYNPIHACYYVLRTLARLPEVWFDEPAIASSASEAAGINEGHGLSILFSSQRSAQQYLETIMSHVSGIMRYTNESKFTFELMRATIAATSLLEITDDDFVEEPVVLRKTWLDIASEIKIQHHIRYSVTGEAEGVPDIYSFAYCDESTDYNPPNGQGYTKSNIDWTHNDLWTADFNAAKASPKPGQRGDGRWFGVHCHVGDPNGFNTSAQNITIPSDYSPAILKAQCGIDYTRVDYFNPTDLAAITQFETWVNANGYRPGSWFVFTFDTSPSNDATQIANQLSDINAMKQYLIDNDYIHQLYAWNETAATERWLDWMLTNVTEN